MYKKTGASWEKHIDFIMLDMLTLALGFLIASYIRQYVATPFTSPQIMEMGSLLTQMLIIEIFYLLVMIFGGIHHEIIRRGYLIEFRKTIGTVAYTYALFITFLYLWHEANVFSRAIYVMGGLLGIFFMYVGRTLHKIVLHRYLERDDKQGRILVVVEEARAAQHMERLQGQDYSPYKIAGLVLHHGKEEAKSEADGLHETVLASKTTEAKYLNEAERKAANLRKSEEAAIEKTKEITNEYAVVCDFEDIEEYVTHHVVDEVMMDLDDRALENKLVLIFLEAGITVHISMYSEIAGWPNCIVERVGGESVLTTANSMAPGWQLFAKRVMDICGGFVGCLLMSIIFVFVAPQIKKADPGPVFFKQKRVGRNGRVFEIYKFRSMYMDAEKRKAELMSQNEMDGLMFKMENDPRILPGIGHRIRDWSLDEFPQFINVLKGDMSLVGTRPPTVQEYEQYETHHKMRLSFRPGITGMWQVSGRNNITDFEEICRLDTLYIQEWNIWEDIKIIWKTIFVVLKKEGSR